MTHSAGICLIVKLDHIGDFAVCIPWLRSLANSYQLEVVAGAWNKGWQEVCPWVHKWHFVSFPGYQQYRQNKPIKWRTISDLCLLYWRFRTARPHVAFDLRTFEADWRGRLVCYLSRADHRVGLYGEGRFFLNKAVHISKMHEFDRIGEILQSVFPKCQPCTRDLVTVRRQEKSNSFINLVAHPGAGTQSKKWPESHWRELREFLTKNIPDCTWNWMGGPNDRPLLQKLACPNDGLRECSTIKQGLEAIADADLLICLDSAAAHMAHLVQTRCVTIFSAANLSARWKALGRNKIVERPIDCSPCHRSMCPLPNHPCMSQITPNEILEVVMQQIKAFQKG